MTGDSRDRQASTGGSGEAELSERLNRLAQRLEERTPGTAGGSSNGSGGQADMRGVGQALRLSTEFIAGIAAGAFLGWIADRFIGTRPWGLIVLTMLGFAAGVMNVMRASGMLGTAEGRLPKDN